MFVKEYVYLNYSYTFRLEIYCIVWVDIVREYLYKEDVKI